MSDIPECVSIRREKLRPLEDKVGNCSKCTLKTRALLLEQTLRKAMETLPQGEHLHVVSIIIEQNESIGQLKKQIKSLKRGRKWG